MRLKGKVGVVTGAARGIGREVALKFGSEGANVVLTDLDEQLVQDAARSVEALGVKAISLACDISDKKQIDHLADQALQEFGGLDIWTNIAGGSTYYQREKDETHFGPDASRVPSEDMDSAYWDYVIDNNLKSTFLCCQTAIRHMKRLKRGGRIINTSSQCGRTALLTSGVAYSASKAGVIGLTRHLAAELAQEGITCNAVAPGFFPSQRIHDLYVAEEGPFHDVYKKMISGIPIGRGGKLEEVAAAYVFLASDESSYVTGAVLDVNGGWFIG